MHAQHNRWRSTNCTTLLSRMASAATQGPERGMKKNFYNKNSSTQASGVCQCVQLLEQAAGSVPLGCTAGQHVHIAEWGCAHGGNSFIPINSICSILDQRATSLGSHAKPLQVHVSLTDVTTNSWQELFQCLQDYQKVFSDTVPCIQLTYSGIGSSQYVRNLPNSSVDLGYTFNAMHWLSKPCNLKHAVISFVSKVLPEERQVLQARAQQDMLEFLMLRAKEFKEGGLLVMSYGTLTDDCRWLGLFEAAQQVAEAMVAEGLLKEDELGKLAAPVFFLDQALQKEVFDAAADQWEVLHFDVVMAENAKAAEVLKAGSADTSVGQLGAGFMQGFMHTFMEQGLKAAGRSPDTIQSLLDMYFARLAQHVDGNPVMVGYPVTRVLLRRKSID